MAFIIRDSNTRHALALQFPRPKWTNKNRTRECENNSPFITLPLVVLAVVNLAVVLGHTQTMYSRKLFPCLQFFGGKHQAQNIFNTNIFENEIFFKEKFSDYSILMLTTPNLIPEP